MLVLRISRRSLSLAPRNAIIEYVPVSYYLGSRKQAEVAELWTDAFNEIDADSSGYIQLTGPKPHFESKRPEDDCGISIFSIDPAGVSRVVSAMVLSSRKMR